MSIAREAAGGALVVAIVAALVAGASKAEPLDLPGSDLPGSDLPSLNVGPVPGAIVSPKSPLPLRNSPPAGVFRWKGEELATALPGQKYYVVDQIRIPSLFGQQVWVSVAPVGGLGGVCDSGCWAFVGRENSAPNFENVPGEKSKQP